MGQRPSTLMQGREAQTAAPEPVLIWRVPLVSGEERTDAHNAQVAPTGNLNFKHMNSCLQAANPPTTKGSDHACSCRLAVDPASPSMAGSGCPSHPLLSSEYVYQGEDEAMTVWKQWSGGGGGSHASWAKSRQGWP